MDFSNAPIAELDGDELSCQDESDRVEPPLEGALKRSMSDPFDISGGLQLQASLEHLVWTFDENVSIGLVDSSELGYKKDVQKQRNSKATLDAIKSFWKISVAPIDNPAISYPLEKRPITFELEDLHMADADSVSEAEFEAFSPNTELLLEREKQLARSRLENGYSSSDSLPASLSSSSSSALTGPSTPSRLQIDGLSTAAMPTVACLTAEEGEEEEEEEEAEEDVIVRRRGQLANGGEDADLDASLRWAGLQASLEVFKARHPTLPMEATEAWARDLENLSPSVLEHYCRELDAATCRVSEQLIGCLAEREELRLFREVLDDFVVLHNAVQLRRRKAAEAVLSNTTRFTLAHIKHYLLGHSVHRRVPRGGSPGSMVELTTISNHGSSQGLSKGSSGEATHNGSIVSLNNEPRMPRGHPIGDPIEFSGLRSAFSRLSGLFLGPSAGGDGGEDILNLATRVVSDAENSERRLVVGSKVTRRLIEDVQKQQGTKLLVRDLPWPMGRPECSQSLKLQIQIPPHNQLPTWLPPRLRIINEILYTALHEAPGVSQLLEELAHFDPEKEAQKLQRTYKYLSESGFESAQVDSRQIMFPSGNGDQANAQRKSVTFDWRGTKEPFKIHALEYAKKIGSAPSHTASVV